MIVCKECKKTITHNNYYYVDMTNEYLCSNSCKLAYAKKEKEKEDKNFLYDTIKRIFNISFPNVQQLTEIKRLREKEGMTNKQIASILHYIYDVKQLSPYGYSLTLVPRYKEEAKEWYMENQRRAHQAQEIAKKAPVVARRMEKINTTRDKKRGILEINPEDV